MVIIEFNKRFRDGTVGQRNQIQRGPQAAGLYQGNFTLFCDAILMTHPLHFDSVGFFYFVLWFVVIFFHSFALL